MANAPTTLLKEIGAVDNANAIDIDALRTLRRWLDEDDDTRARVVTELAAYLDRARTASWFQEFKSVCAASDRRFNDMLAVGRTLDRLIRARLPLAEKPLLELVRFSTDRSDYSGLRLTAQLEHYGKTHAVSEELREALGAMVAYRYMSSHYAKLRARIGWLTSPEQPARVASSATPAHTESRAPRTRSRPRRT